jgi:hypothetical protein
VTLFLMILHPQMLGITIDSKFSGWTHALGVHPQDLSFLSFYWVWGHEILGIASLRDASTSLKIWFQSLSTLGDLVLSWRGWLACVFVDVFFLFVRDFAWTVRVVGFTKISVGEFDKTLTPSKRRIVKIHETGSRINNGRKVQFCGKGWSWRNLDVFRMFHEFLNKCENNGRTCLLCSNF